MRLEEPRTRGRPLSCASRGQRPRCSRRAPPSEWSKPASRTERIARKDWVHLFQLHGCRSGRRQTEPPPPLDPATPRDGRESRRIGRRWVAKGFRFPQRHATSEAVHGIPGFWSLAFSLDGVRSNRVCPPETSQSGPVAQTLFSGDQLRLHGKVPLFFPPRPPLAKAGRQDEDCPIRQGAPPPPLADHSARPIRALCLATSRGPLRLWQSAEPGSHEHRTTQAAPLRIFPALLKSASEPQGLPSRRHRRRSYVSVSLAPPGGPMARACFEHGTARAAAKKTQNPDAPSSPRCHEAAPRASSPPCGPMYERACTLAAPS